VSGAAAVARRQTKGQGASRSDHQPYRMRLPGFISDQEVGLGDVIKRVTYGLGIKPCGGCERRADALNRWLAFSGRR
jgi:hypothetical protein